MIVADLIDPYLLAEMIEAGYVRRTPHPELPLRILNYTERAAYDRVWNDATLQSRGLIYEADHPHRIVARPFPKFFNYGEPSAPELDLAAPAVVTDKLDGSLGILYPAGDGYAVATRGSFTSEQALHATALLREHYPDFRAYPGLTYLFEIIYPGNRVVCDYGYLDDLVLLAVLDVATGLPAPSVMGDWPGPVVERHPYETLAEALAAEPRPNAEGLVVYLPGENARVKIKQDDYVALHRILTGTNARNVWEAAAVLACRDLIREPKHWGTYLGIDPARAAELLELDDDWLEAAGVPDEFYGWVGQVTAEVWKAAAETNAACRAVAGRASVIADRAVRYAYVCERAPGNTVTETMRLASAFGAGEAKLQAARDEVFLRSWREACPEPTAPFQRSEAVA